MEKQTQEEGGRDENRGARERRRFTKALRISPLCNSICVLKSIFEQRGIPRVDQVDREGGPLEFLSRGATSLEFPRGGRRALERCYNNAAPPPPSASLFAGNGIPRSSRNRARNFKDGTQCYREIFLRLETRIHDDSSSSLSLSLYCSSFPWRRRERVVERLD